MTLLKILFKIFSTLIILFFMLSIWVAFFVDINHYKAEISQFVEQEAGLTLDIKGDLQLSLISGIKFNAENIQLFNDKELIADIKSISLGISAVSLYDGAPEITSIDLSLRKLIMSRDKKDRYNFLPLYKAEDTQSDSDSAEKLSLNSLAINDIHLVMDHFQFNDKLNALSITLNNSEANLSFLPIIDHHELIIDDPRLLVDYTYKGTLEVKKALLNHYHISDLSMEIKDKNGDFVVDKLLFSFLEEGKNHAPPPIVLDASGNLAVQLRYKIAEGYSKPLWTKPDVLTISQFDFNLKKFKLADKQYQVEAAKTHLVFANMGVFSARHYLLDELQIKSLNIETNKLSVSSKTEGQYDFNQFVLQLKNVPVIHKTQPLDPLSTDFLKAFAQKGMIKLSSDSVQHKAQSFDKLDITLTGSIKKIDLLLSALVVDSPISIDGFFKAPQTKKEKDLQWQLNIRSNKLNLKSISALMNYPVKIEGFSSTNTFLSGTYQHSDFKIMAGKIHTTADNLQVDGININNIMEDFESSQSVKLLDVGAVVLLGPGGVVLTKGNDYNSLLNSISNQGSSKISQLNVRVDFADDIAAMTDVAFATEKHRLAVKGKINLQEETFLNFEVATINQHGCAIYKEEVLGSINDPKVKKVNFLVKGVVNPITSLLTKITDPLKIKCQTPFYSGVIKAPVVSTKRKKPLKNILNSE